MTKNTKPTVTKPENANRASMAFMGCWRRFRASVVSLYTNDYQLLLAFGVPFAIMFLAYFIFGVNPFEGESVLSLDLNGQYVYYYDYMYDVFAGKESLFYSWSRNLSGEFMGIIGYYLASPFNLIVWLFPRACITDGLFAMMLTKIGAIGLCCGIYLSRGKGCNRLTTVLFSTMYALCSYTLVQTMNPMWLDGVMALPLIVYGLEKLVDEGKFRLFIVSLAYSFITCFYIGFMLGIFAAIYFLYYLACSDSTLKLGAATIFRRIGLCGASAAVALMCSMFMILPVYESLQLGKFAFSTPDFSLVYNFNLIELLTKLLPNSYDTVRMIGLPFIYCGTLTLLMIPVYLISTKYSIREKVGTIIVIGILIFSMFVRPVDMIWHGGQLPNWLPYRYSFIVSFLMIVMGAKGFNRLSDVRLRFIGFTAVFYMGVLVFIENMDTFVDTLGSKGRDVVEPLQVILPAMFVLLVITTGVLSFKYKFHRKSCAIFMCVLVGGEALFSSLGNLMKQDQDIVYSSRASYVDVIVPTREVVEKIKAEDDGFYRIEKTYHRTVNDPMALNMYGLSHSSSTLNAKPIQLLRMFGFTSRSHYTRYSGATELTNDLFGVKYILSTKGNTTSFESADDITVTKNEDALPIAYLVDDDIRNLIFVDDYRTKSSEYNELYADNEDFVPMKSPIGEYYVTLQNEKPFTNQTLLMQAMLGDETAATYYERIYETDFIPENVGEGHTTDGHNSYKVVTEGENSQIEFILEIEKAGKYYMYLPTSYEHTVNVWINNRWIEEEKDFEGTHDWGGNYFEGDNYCIKCIGEYEAGEHVSVILTLTESSLYFKDSYFMWENSEKIAEDTARLQELNKNTVVTAKSTTNFLIETNCEQDKILQTTIPVEKGWKCYVDGVQTDYITTMSDSLIAVPLTAGAHTVELTFTTAGYPAALIITLAGIVFFAGMILLWLKLRNFRNTKRPDALIAETGDDDSDEDDAYYGDDEIADEEAVDNETADDKSPDQAENSPPVVTEQTPDKDDGEKTE